MVTKFGGQILATKFGSVPDWYMQNITWGPFHKYKLTLNPSLDIYSCPEKYMMELSIRSQTSTTAPGMEWINNFIPQFMVDVIIYPC